MTGISSWSIQHPIPTIVFFLVLTVAGIAGFRSMRVNNVPDIDVPAVVVTVAQPGAAPPELETQVTRPIEDAVAGLGSIEHIRSVVNDGVSVTTIEFVLGVDSDRVTNDVRNAVSAVRSELPADAEEPVVQRIDAAGGSLLTYVVRAPDLSPEALSWFVDNDVAKALLAIEGVSQVARQGGVDREIQVRLDPTRLAAMGVTAGDVSHQLRRINANLPGGRATVGTGEQSIRTLGSALTVEALASTRIDLADGRTVRLSDLGTALDSWAEPRSRARFDGEEVVGFGVVRTRGTSEVRVAELARNEIARLDAARDDVQFEEVTSSVQFVQESYLASVEALLLGALLAVAVVWWFLRDVRATLISAVAMPLSLLPTFAVMAWLNQSFNIVTLLALSLTVGILVDDAIVEIENIVRHMRQGKAPYPASLEAADEIGLAVVATTFTILAVFVPVGFMPSVVGQFFKAFAIASCVSVLFSLVVARTLTPLLCAYLLRSTDAGAHGEPAWIRQYAKLLSWALDHRRIVLVSGLAIFAGSLALASFLPSDFVPVSDRGRSVLSVELPPGTTLAESDDVVQRITTMLETRPEVESVYSAIGTTMTEMGPGGGATSQGDVRRSVVTVNLVPRHSRALTQQEFETQIGETLRRVPGARVRFGADGSSGAKLSIALASDDPTLLAQASRQVEREMRGVEGLSNVASTANLARPEILIRPKPDKAAALGVAAETISQVARVATLGDVDASLPKFNLADRQIPIRLILIEEARADADTIENLRVPTLGGGSVPLSAVADVEFGAGPSQIDRLDRRRSATIEGELAGLPLGEASERVHALPGLRNLPAGVSEVPAGDSERRGELFTGFAIACGTGILLMYVVLALLFEGFAHPFTILTALPLSIGGAFGLLILSDRALSLPALIGILMLMGIAAKNSILLAEYALTARARDGLSRRDALMDAGRKRARPIEMTTFAMGAGMLPIALGFGADVEFRSPMAIAVIGGLITSTVLSLVFVPVAFTFVDDLQGWLGSRLGTWAKPEHGHARSEAGKPAADTAAADANAGGTPAVAR